MPDRFDMRMSSQANPISRVNELSTMAQFEIRLHDELTDLVGSERFERFLNCTNYGVYLLWSHVSFPFYEVSLTRSCHVRNKSLF